jgi:hypothetical protein
MAVGRLAYDDYPAWLRDSHGVSIDPRLKNRYETTARAIRTAFGESSFWSRLPAHLRESEAAYRVDTGYPLLDPSQVPVLVIKPFDSFVLKTYRKNVTENVAWPDPPPATGWLLPPRVAHVKDAVRTYLVVKYLDGPAFLSTKLAELALTEGIAFHTDFEAREEGYYAAHAYVTREYEVPAERWDTEIVTASVEIQITTQVQEVIRRLLHRYYETRRATSASEIAHRWQWDYESDEFAANYLGHILHYVEGMIMDVRERQATEAPR